MRVLFCVVFWAIWTAHNDRHHGRSPWNHAIGPLTLLAILYLPLKLWSILSMLKQKKNGTLLLLVSLWLIWMQVLLLIPHQVPQVVLSEMMMGLFWGENELGMIPFLMLLLLQKLLVVMVHCVVVMLLLATLLWRLTVLFWLTFGSWGRRIGRPFNLSWIICLSFLGSF